MKKKIIGVFLFVLLTPFFAQAATVELIWEKPVLTGNVITGNNAPKGYIVYFGMQADKEEFHKTVVGEDALTTTVEIPNDGNEYFFAVKAYNDYGESGLSNEESVTANPYQPPTDNLPVILGAPGQPTNLHKN